MKEDKIEELGKKGTTTVGLVFKDGVVLAADKRATQRYLIAHKDVDKILKITDRILITTAGLVGDNQMLRRFLRSQLKLFQVRREERPSIKAAATYLANLLYSRRFSFSPFHVQILLAGYEGEAGLYSLGADGSALPDNYIATGSGSPVAYGVLQEKYEEEMSKSNAIKLAIKAIDAAIERDIGTGEGIDVKIVTSEGIEEYPESKIKELATKA